MKVHAFVFVLLLVASPCCGAMSAVAVAMSTLERWSRTALEQKLSDEISLEQGRAENSDARFQGGAHRGQNNFGLPRRRSRRQRKPRPFEFGAGDEKAQAVVRIALGGD